MKKVIFLLFCLLGQLTVNAQTLKHDIRYFSIREYGKGHEAANWAAVQDKNGVLYFGNAGGLLQYDGLNWNFIAVKQQSVWVKSLAVSEDNVIYVGAQNEFGYLETDAVGVFRYVSLSDSLENDKRNFTDIIRVYAWNNQVVFQAEEALFLYMDGRLLNFIPETSYHLSFLAENEFYIRQRELGILKLSGNELKLLPGSEFFKDKGVFSILQSNDNGKLLIFTREDGIWNVNRDNFEATPVSSNNADLLMRSEIYGAIKLKDGNIALNTLSNGILIINENLSIISHIHKNNGLRVNGVLTLLQDFQENLWAGLDNGIAQVDYSSPVSVYRADNGISGNIKALAQHEEKLFAGTTEGLFVQENENTFTLFNGFRREIRSICTTGKSLLAASQYGLYEVKDNLLNKINEEDVNALYYASSSGLLFVSCKNGLKVYRQAAGWIKVLEIPEINEEIVCFEEESGSDILTLWMGTALQGIIRLKYSSETDYAVDKYYGDDGLEDNTWVIPMRLDSQIIFSQHSGLLEFVNEETLRAQLPDSLKDRPEFSRGYFEFYSGEQLKDLPASPVYTLSGNENRIYANLDGELGYFDKNKSYRWITAPFILTDIGKANIFLQTENGICWIGGNDGLLRYDEKVIKSYSLDYFCLITNVYCDADSLIYSGYNGKNENPDKSLTGHHTALNYSYNTLSFNFSAPFFEGQEKILYSYKLDGQDKDWSSWQPDTRVVLSNLFEGEYTFRVRAKNAYGHVSSESIYSFAILPPWYRTSWAIIIYVLLLIAVIYGGIRFNSRRLIEKNKKLEAIILERTQEIKQKNVVLEHQKQEILDSINYAQRIQKAVLTEDELIKSWLGEHFILFRPKDIVSGDFFWASRKEQYVCFCVADCTGHGVPGAFMSMLCISFLNEVVLKEGLGQTNQILDRLRKMIIESLKQKGVEGEQKDGMDINLCILNTLTNELQYSGANNNLYIVRHKDKAPVSCGKTMELGDHVLYELKSDNMPISIHLNMSAFKECTVSVEKGDSLYLFTDGFADQFGGPAENGRGKKFMSKTFKTAILECTNLSMEAQQIQLEKHLNNWMAFINPDTGKPYEQVDDICVMGVRVW